MLIEQKFYLPESFKEIVHSLPILDEVTRNKVKSSKALIEENCNLKNYIEELELIEEIATKILSCYKQAIIIGIGGAISASRTYTSYYNYQSPKFKLFYSDNISIEKQNDIFTKDNLKHSAIIIISRSGQSIETLSQTYNVIDKYNQYFGKQYNIGKHFYIITYDENMLTSIGRSINAHIFDYTSRSGKFSAFSTVGLLPAKLIGLCPKKIIDGAFRALEQFDYALESAWIAFQLMHLNYNINVLSNYDDKFEEILKWYSQISSEIISKNQKGSTSIVAGIFDQHGHWQLFLAGPNDKYFTILWNKETEETSKTSQIIRETYYKLNKKRLIQKKVPLREIIITKVNEESLGFLMMQLLLEAVFLAEHLNVSSVTHPEIESHKKILSRIYSSYLKNCSKQKL